MRCPRCLYDELVQYRVWGAVTVCCSSPWCTFEVEIRLTPVDEIVLESYVMCGDHHRASYLAVRSIADGLRAHAHYIDSSNKLIQQEVCSGLAGSGLPLPLIETAIVPFVVTSAEPSYPQTPTSRIAKFWYRGLRIRWVWAPTDDTDVAFDSDGDY